MSTVELIAEKVWKQISKATWMAQQMRRRKKDD